VPNRRAVTECVQSLSGCRDLRQLDSAVKALLSRETLNEQEILQVTGLPSAPALETVPLAVVDVDRRVAVSR
jgi:hypothetical protein